MIIKREKEREEGRREREREKKKKWIVDWYGAAAKVYDRGRPWPIVRQTWIDGAPIAGCPASTADTTRMQSKPTKRSDGNSICIQARSPAPSNPIPCIILIFILPAESHLQPTADLYIPYRWFSIQQLLPLFLAFFRFLSVSVVALESVISLILPTWSVWIGFSLRWLLLLMLLLLLLLPCDLYFIGLIRVDLLLDINGSAMIVYARAADVFNLIIAP